MGDAMSSLTWTIGPMAPPNLLRGSAAGRIRSMILISFVLRRWVAASIDRRSSAEVGAWKAFLSSVGRHATYERTASRQAGDAADLVLKESVAIMCWMAHLLAKHRQLVR